jgi:RimJ/RimL family protein N-acetyltransferase
MRRHGVVSGVPRTYAYASRVPTLVLPVLRSGVFSGHTQPRALRWKGEHGADWVVRREGAPVGRVGLRTVDLEEGRAEVAYWTAPEARGNGVAIQALTALSNWALETVGFHRLDLHHSVQNAASCRVAVKCGYEVEGTAHSSVLHSDGWHDMHLHARINRGSGRLNPPRGHHRSE